LLKSSLSPVWIEIRQPTSSFMPVSYHRGLRIMDRFHGWEPLRRLPSVVALLALVVATACQPEDETPGLWLRGESSAAE
jgi:hypothetical protein